MPKKLVAPAGLVRLLAMISPLKIVGVSFLSFLGFACSDDPETPMAVGGAGAPASGGSPAGGSGGTASAGAANGGSPMGGSGGAAGGSGGAVGGSGGATGGNTPACMPIAAPAGSMLAAPKLVIAEIALGGAEEHIVIHNNSAEPVDLATFGLCSNFAYYKGLAELAGVATLDPGAFVTVEIEPFFQTGAGAAPEKGELLISETASGVPGSADDVHDYVCWGAFEGGRKESEGVKRFAGPCAGAMAAGALRRIPGTSGEDAASYDSAVAPASCGM